MDDPRPAWQIASAVAVLVVASTGVVLYSSTLTAPGCATTSGTPCPLHRENVSYASEQVILPSHGAGFGPITSVTFDRVQFRLWPELQAASSAFVQGTGQEPSGVNLAFVVFPLGPPYGTGPTPANESAHPWFSPDGVFGVDWVPFSGSAITVALFVSDPLVTYDSFGVDLSPDLLLPGWTAQQVVESPDGVDFYFGIAGWGSPAGPFLNATAVELHGETVFLGIWDRPLFACGLLGDTPSGVLENATCLESAAPDHAVALVWDGYLHVTLLVRVG